MDYGDGSADLESTILKLRHLLDEKSTSGEEPTHVFTNVTLPSVDVADGTLFFVVKYCQETVSKTVMRSLADFKELKSRLPEKFPIEVPENLESNEHLRLLLQSWLQEICSHPTMFNCRSLREFMDVKQGSLGTIDRLYF